MKPAHPRTVLYAAWAPFYSGAERALVLLLQGLDRARYRPVVALGTDGELRAQLRAMDVETHHVPIAYSDRRHPGAWLGSVAKFTRLAWRHRAAIVHSNDAPSFQPAGYAARWLGRPAVTHVRFPDSAAGFGWFLKPGFARALFVSEGLRGPAIQEAPALFRDRSEVVYDGVVLPDLPDDATRRAIRAELGLPVDRPVVAITGQVAEIKGIWEFIAAARLLIDRGAPAFFAVLGDDLKGKGALRVQAEARVAELGLSTHFRFLGFRSDAPRVIPVFDVIAVPSHVEPLGNATLEAMAAALPVVGSRVGGIPEMIVDEVTGRLVPSRDPGSLADALEALLRDPARAKALGRAGRQRAAEKFSVSAHAAQVQAIYDSVLSSQ